MSCVLTVMMQTGIYVYTFISIFTTVFELKRKRNNTTLIIVLAPVQPEINWFADNLITCKGSYSGKQASVGRVQGETRHQIPILPAFPSPSPLRVDLDVLKGKISL